MFLIYIYIASYFVNRVNMINFFVNDVNIINIKFINIINNFIKKLSNLIIIYYFDLIMLKLNS